MASGQWHLVGWLWGCVSVCLSVCSWLCVCVCGCMWVWVWVWLGGWVAGCGCGICHLATGIWLGGSVSVCLCVWLCVAVCLCVCVSVCACVCVCVCVCVSVCVCVCPSVFVWVGGWAGGCCGRCVLCVVCVGGWVGRCVCGSGHDKPKLPHGKEKLEILPTTGDPVAARKHRHPVPFRASFRAPSFLLYQTGGGKDPLLRRVKRLFARLPCDTLKAMYFCIALTPGQML